MHGGEHRALVRLGLGRPSTAAAGGARGCLVASRRGIGGVRRPTSFVALFDSRGLLSKLLAGIVADGGDTAIRVELPATDLSVAASFPKREA